MYFGLGADFKMCFRLCVQFKVYISLCTDFKVYIGLCADFKMYYGLCVEFKMYFCMCAEFKVYFVGTSSATATLDYDVIKTHLITVKCTDTATTATGTAVLEVDISTILQGRPLMTTNSFFLRAEHCFGNVAEAPEEVASNSSSSAMIDFVYWKCMEEKIKF